MSKRTRQTSIFIALWEFQVKPGREKAFQRIYGCRGEWANLFLRSKDYLGTALIRTSRRSRRYITADVWTSRAAYNLFCRRFRAAYATLDSRCAPLTVRETRIGQVQV